MLGQVPSGAVARSASASPSGSALASTVIGNGPRRCGVSARVCAPLMDPLADKLLIVAALVALVSLHRLAAWVAMVIITRELAVTVLRMGASQAGVVLAASIFGKIKTCLQIAAILAVIAVHGKPLWVSALLYLTVAVTVLSGLDFFFDLRRQMAEAQARSAGNRASSGS